MDNIQKRFILFLIGCMGSRFSLVYLSKTIKNPTFITLFGIFLIAIGTSFMVLFLNDCRKTGPEVFGGKIWWNSLRPIHSILYFSAGVMCLTGYYNNVWQVLLTDVSIGLLSFLYHHILCQQKY
jgi:hypothetical protein